MKDQHAVYTITDIDILQTNLNAISVAIFIVGPRLIFPVLAV